ncbi:MAG: DeoR/GlpR family DNA-binding transcription regulator [Sphaerochaetaceae bacterium]|nr:DeoR/GlpR family DNA-binding transcription regulator [Sphaerochaetaceae bacterium]
MAQLIPVQRQKQILSILLAEETAQVSDLARRLGVSDLTIRRDLDQMAEKGMVERSFGGASLMRSLSSEPDYTTKAMQFATEKESIGQVAAMLVSDGDTICINSGSTTFEVIKAIIETGKNVTIVTNNIGIFPLLSSDIKARIIFTGGVYRSISHSVSGNMSLPVLDGIYASKAFIGVDGFSLEQGLTTPIQEEALTTKKMIEHTVGKVYAVFTASKIGVVSNYKTVDAAKIGCVITDEAGRRLLGGLHEIGIEALFA